MGRRTVALGEWRLKSGYQALNWQARTSRVCKGGNRAELAGEDEVGEAAAACGRVDSVLGCELEA